jgi:hypothetical protein
MIVIVTVENVKHKKAIAVFSGNPHPMYGTEEEDDHHCHLKRVIYCKDIY